MSTTLRRVKADGDITRDNSVITRCRKSICSVNERVIHPYDQSQSPYQFQCQRRPDNSQASGHIEMFSCECRRQLSYMIIAMKWQFNLAYQLHKQTGQTGKQQGQKAASAAAQIKVSFWALCQMVDIVRFSCKTHS